MRLGWPEIILVIAVILIVFGVGKLPQVGAQLGKGIREFRKATQGEREVVVVEKTEIDGK